MKKLFVLGALLVFIAMTAAHFGGTPTQKQAEIWPPSSPTVSIE